MLTPSRHSFHDLWAKSFIPSVGCRKRYMLPRGAPTVWKPPLPRPFQRRTAAQHHARQGREDYSNREWFEEYILRNVQQKPCTDSKNWKERLESLFLASRILTLDSSRNLHTTGPRWLWKLQTFNGERDAKVSCSWNKVHAILSSHVAASSCFVALVNELGRDQISYSLSIIHVAIISSCSLALSALCSMFNLSTDIRIWPQNVTSTKRY